MNRDVVTQLLEENNYQSSDRLTQALLHYIVDLERQLAPKKSYEYSGVVERSEEFYGSYIIKLDRPIEGRLLAVVGQHTYGIYKLLNDSNQSTPEDLRVTGLGQLGPSVLVARTIKSA